MKHRLFWKILLAFWLTFIAITQGVWLLFELSRTDRAPPERLMVEQVAPVVLAAAAEAVSESGPPGFERLTRQWEPETRRRVTLGDPAVKRAGPPLPAALIRDVKGPDGQAYRLTFTPRGPPQRLGLFHTPPELLIVGALGGLLFSGLLAWYLLHPINRLRQGFERLARGDLEVRIAPSIGRRRDEIADLARDFDLMAQRLEQLVGLRDRLLHDVSHELRSPLARLQLAIGLARQSPARTGHSLDRIEEEARRLDAMVDELLTLARAENGIPMGEDYFDLPLVVASVVEDARFEAQEKNVAIQLYGYLPAEDQRPPLRGHAEMIRRAFDNVVRNALRYSSQMDVVCIELHSDAGGGYTVDVLDEGPGVSRDDLPGIFDPFVSGQGEGDGAGLGLAIAQRAIAAHGGKITARNRPDRGLAVTITLPGSSQT